MNPDTIGYVWTGESDLNTLLVDGEICESGKKKLRIKKYPDTGGTGPDPTAWLATEASKTGWRVCLHYELVPVQSRK